MCRSSVTEKWKRRKKWRWAIQSHPLHSLFCDREKGNKERNGFEPSNHILSTLFFSSFHLSCEINFYVLHAFFIKSKGIVATKGRRVMAGVTSSSAFVIKQKWLTCFESPSLVSLLVIKRLCIPQAFMHTRSCFWWIQLSAEDKFNFFKQVVS